MIVIIRRLDDGDRVHATHDDWQWPMIDASYPADCAVGRVVTPVEYGTDVPADIEWLRPFATPAA